MVRDWPSWPRNTNRKGVAFFGVDSNRQDSVTEMAKFAKEHKHRLSVAEGFEQRAGRQALGAARNPQVFVLDRDRTVRYAGRIDDQYGFQTGSGYAKTRVNRHDLVAALDELLAGKPVSQPTTEAIGCLIGRVRKAADDSDVTYSNQIARVFQKRCVECHRPGQIGPFALEKLRGSRRLGRDDRGSRAKTSGCPPGSPTRSSATSRTTRR